MFFGHRFEFTRCFVFWNRQLKLKVQKHDGMTHVQKL